MADLKVLYVDDEPDIRTIASLALSLDPGIEAKAVSSAAEALAVLADGSWTPDVALLDVMMPEMDGPTLFEEMKTRHPGGPPVIFMTAKARADDVARYVGAGAIGVISKPFDPMTLAKELRALAGKAA